MALRRFEELEAVVSIPPNSQLALQPIGDVPPVRIPARNVAGAAEEITLPAQAFFATPAAASANGLQVRLGEPENIAAVPPTLAAAARPLANADFGPDFPNSMLANPSVRADDPDGQAGVTLWWYRTDLEGLYYRGGNGGVQAIADFDDSAGASVFSTGLLWAFGRTGLFAERYGPGTARFATLADFRDHVIANHRFYIQQVDVVNRDEFVFYNTQDQELQVIEITAVGSLEIAAAEPVVLGPQMPVMQSDILDVVRDTTDASLSTPALISDPFILGDTSDVPPGGVGTLVYYSLTQVRVAFWDYGRTPNNTVPADDGVFISHISWGNDSNENIPSTRHRDIDALRDVIDANFANFRARYDAGQTHLAWFDESANTFGISEIVSIPEERDENIDYRPIPHLAETSEIANRWVLRGRQRFLGRPASAEVPASYSSAVSVNGDLIANGSWQPQVGDSFNSGGPSDGETWFRYNEGGNPVRLIRWTNQGGVLSERPVRGDSDIWEPDVTWADRGADQSNAQGSRYSSNTGRFADDAAVLAYITSSDNVAMFNARHAAGRTRIAYFNTTNDTVRIGSYVPHVPAVARVEADPLAVSVDEDAQAITVFYAPVAGGLVVTPDEFGDIQDEFDQLIIGGVRTSYVGNADDNTQVIRPVPWEVPFAGGQVVTINFDGVAAGPPQNIFTGNDRAEAVQALRNYSAANPGWRAFYLADQRLTVGLRWGNAGEGTTYILDQNGVWRDIGLVWLKGDQGQKGDPGDAGMGNFTPAERAKLQGIETRATADQTGAEIKAAYEAQPDTNAYTDGEKSKLAGVENDATADQTGAEIKAAYEAQPNTNPFLDAEKAKLAGIEAGATADLTPAEVVALINTALGQMNWQQGGMGMGTADTDRRLTNVVAALNGQITFTVTSLDGTETSFVSSFAAMVNALADARIANADLATTGALAAAVARIAALEAAGYQTAADVRALIAGAGHATQAALNALTARVARLEGFHPDAGTHTRIAAISADTDLSAAEVMAGESSDTASVHTPTWGNGVLRYIFIGVPTSEADITDIRQSGITVFAGYQAYGVEVSGHKWWRSTVAQDGEFSSNIELEIVQA